MPKRKRAAKDTKYFVFDDTSLETLFKVYQEKNGNWTKIMADKAIKQMGCFRNDAKDQIIFEKTGYNVQFTEKCTSLSLEELSKWIKDWRFDINFVSNKKKKIIFNNILI